MVVAAAELSKTAGNTAFKREHYELALSHYTTAIQLDPSVSTYPLNRSLVHLKLNSFTLAEKDATTALNLDGGANVKALFRRALARKKIGKLRDAKKDLEEAMKQGAGQDAQTELDHLNKQLVQENSNSTNTESVSPPESSPPVTAARSRADRLRAAISSSSTPSTVPSTASDEPTEEKTPSTPSLRSSPTVDNDSFGMTAVSTRKLKTSPTATPSSTIGSDEASALHTISTNESDSSAKETTPASSFAAKKLSRQTRQQSPLFTIPPPVSSSPAPAPSLTPAVTKSPEHPSTLTPRPSNSRESTNDQSTLSPPAAHSSAPIFPLKPSRPQPSSKSISSHHQNNAVTLTSLESHLLLSPRGSRSRIDLLKSLDPSPSTLVPFVGDSLTPDLLSLILFELDLDLNRPSSTSTEDQAGLDGNRKRDDEDHKGWMVDLLQGLSHCRRFETSRMLLSDEELQIVGKVLESEKERLKQVEQGWGL